MNEIRLLKRWLRIDGNSQASLAARLGYKSSLTIGAWINNGKIPARQKAAVLAIIEETLNVTDEQDHKRKSKKTTGSDDSCT